MTCAVTTVPQDPDTQNPNHPRRRRVWCTGRGRRPSRRFSLGRGYEGGATSGNIQSPPFTFPSPGAMILRIAVRSDVSPSPFDVLSF